MNHFISDNSLSLLKEESIEATLNLAYEFAIRICRGFFQNYVVMKKEKMSFLVKVLFNSSCSSLKPLLEGMFQRAAILIKPFSAKFYTLLANL